MVDFSITSKNMKYKLLLENCCFLVKKGTLALLMYFNKRKSSEVANYTKKLKNLYKVLLSNILHTCFQSIMSRIGIFTKYWRPVLVLSSLLAITISVIAVESESGKQDQVH